METALYPTRPAEKIVISCWTFGESDSSLLFLDFAEESYWSPPRFSLSKSFFNSSRNSSDIPPPPPSSRTLLQVANVSDLLAGVYTFGPSVSQRRPFFSETHRHLHSGSGTRSLQSSARAFRQRSTSGFTCLENPKRTVLPLVFSWPQPRLPQFFFRRIGRRILYPM